MLTEGMIEGGRPWLTSTALLRKTSAAFSLLSLCLRVCCCELGKTRPPCRKSIVGLSLGCFRPWASQGGYEGVRSGARRHSGSCLSLLPLALADYVYVAAVKFSCGFMFSSNKCSLACGVYCFGHTPYAGKFTKRSRARWIPIYELYKHTFQGGLPRSSGCASRLVEQRQTGSASRLRFNLHEDLGQKL